MSLVLLAEAQTRVGASVTQDMIDEAEEWLAARVGPLVGVRTETFYHSQRRHRPLVVDGLWLKRPTDAALLTSDGDDLTAGTDFRLIDSLLIERIPDSALWGDTLIATYEPNDEETTRSVIFDLLGYQQTPQGIQSIRIGQYSETYFPGGDRDPVLASFLRRVLPESGLGEFNDPFRYASSRRDRTLVTGAGS